MKTIIFVFFVFFIKEACSQNILTNSTLFNPFDTLNYNEVLIFKRIIFRNFNKERIVVNNAINRNVSDSGKYITLNDRRLLIKTITDTNSYGGDLPSCFRPEYGIVFYYNKTIVGYIDISLSCNQLYSSIYIPAAEYNNTSIGFDEDGEIIAPNNGLKTNAFNIIKGICFNYYTPPLSVE